MTDHSTLQYKTRADVALHGFLDVDEQASHSTTKALHGAIGGILAVCLSLTYRHAT